METLHQPIKPALYGLFTILLLIPAPSQPTNRSSGIARSLGEDLQQQRKGEQPWQNGDKQPPAFTLPDLPKPDSEKPILSQQLKFFCKKIQLTGNNIFPTADLEKLTTPYTNREITNQDLQQLRYELTRYYVDRGYINSGAVIPDQSVSKGILEIKIIEGRLERLEIDGIEHFRESYLKDRIEADAVKPLQVNRLQENLQLLLENPLIERINADLKPGSQPGLAILKTMLKERLPYQLGAVFDNQIAPSIGGYQGTVYAAHRNLTGNGDAFSAQGRFADGLTGYGFDYWLPVNHYDTTFHAWYSHYDSTLVEQPFNQIDVTSNSESYGISLNHPFYRRPGRSFSGSITLERRHSQTFLLGRPFSFSAGVQNGESRITVMRLGQEWISRNTDQVVAVRSTFNIGFGALDATINSNAPDGRFFSWLGQLQWARRIGSAQLIWRTDLQLTDDPLLPLEKFQIGGLNSVRGYRENQIVRDWGFSSSLEYRQPLFIEFSGGEKFFIAPFADVGGAWETQQSSSNLPDVITSVGLGLIWDPDRRIHTQVYWGKALIDVNNPDNDPQDYGFHFKVSGQVF